MPVYHHIVLADVLILCWSGTFKCWTSRDERNWGIFDANERMTDIFSNVTKWEIIFNESSHNQYRMNPLLAIFTVIMSASALPFPQLPSIGHLQDAQSTTKGPKPFTILPSFPESGRKRVVLESESFLGQIDSKYGVAQQAVADVLNPKPIVDTIKEEDKYGNDGERFKNLEGCLSMVMKPFLTP
ncbi:hypothetical protein HHI36_010223 [Cryptolaemus montrouzieri]|uniref:Uncharacterized protein n=1 Tax=Cryptolaemus montrouzieri TaxID=559131 RepID=A0ABD2MIV8_9CUCU